MSGRSIRWVGSILTIAAIGGLTAYLVALGLDKADKIASVIGALSAVAGIALTIHGMIRIRHEPSASQPATTEAVASSSHTHNIISGGSQHGVVIQGRDFYGPISPGISEPNDQKSQK